jgi:hypothetical protein
MEVSRRAVTTARLLTFDEGSEVEHRRLEGLGLLLDILTARFASGA